MTNLDYLITKLSHTLVLGPQGAGKTTYAQNLAIETNGNIVHIDQHKYYRKIKHNEPSYTASPVKIKKFNDKLVSKTLLPLINESKKDSIIEGIQLAHLPESELKNHELVVINPSLKTIIEPRLKRDIAHDKKKGKPERDRSSRVNQIIDDYNYMQPYIQKWKLLGAKEIIRK